MSTPLELFVGRELPGWALFWLDTVGTPVDFTAGSWSFTAAIRQGGVETPLANAVITAYANPTTDRKDTDDVPSVIVEPAAGTLDDLDTGKATIIVVATSGNKDREAQFSAVVNT